MGERQRNEEAHVMSRLAEAICSFDGGSVQDGAKVAAKSAIAEAVSLALAGSIDANVQLLRKSVLGEQPLGPALVYGSDLRVGVLDAAMINAVAATGAGNADTSPARRLAPILAATVALAEERKNTGKDVLLAFMVGARSRRALRDLGEDGVAASIAAAASWLLRLPQQATATALTIALSLGGGSEGLLAGQSARNGLLAALLAEAGVASNLPDIGETTSSDKVFEAWNNEAFMEGALSSDLLWDAFNGNARKGLPREQIAPLFECLETFDSAADMDRITQLMQVSRLHDRVASKPVSFAKRGTEEPQETNWVP